MAEGDDFHLDSFASVPHADNLGRNAAIYFDYNKSSLRKDATIALDQLCVQIFWLSMTDKMGLLVVGHTDYKGQELNNFGLAQLRANAVQQYINNKASKNQITFHLDISLGESKAAQNSKVGAIRAEDRRVDVTIINYKDKVTKLVVAPKPVSVSIPVVKLPRVVQRNFFQFEPPENILRSGPGQFDKPHVQAEAIVQAVKWLGGKALGSDDYYDRFTADWGDEESPTMEMIDSRARVGHTVIKCKKYMITKQMTQTIFYEAEIRYRWRVFDPNHIPVLLTVYFEINMMDAIKKELTEHYFRSYAEHNRIFTP